MQVSHASDHITHAVIGGKKTIDYGISDSPEFFQILSSALYKDPMLAMVREVICNAWDAHIECGRTDQPIQITLSDEYLTIRDSGPGIPDDLIGPIYAVYGASTKKNDGRQTGGFGLGCKSPFAYTDHFEVVSCHNGVRTIYSMSKSSAEVMGKPSINTIATFPTTDTGITVKIPLNPEMRNSRLPDLVRRVVYNGDIMAEFNGTLLPTLGLFESENGLVLVSPHFEETSHLNARIHVRYGNVIYPVEKAHEYADLYDHLAGMLNSYYQCNMVVQADPDTISITPSRDSLTLSDITTGTLKQLLAKASAVLATNHKLSQRRKELLEEYVDAESKVPGEDHRKILKGLSLKAIPGVPDTAEKAVYRSNEDFAKLGVVLQYGRNYTRRAKFPPRLWLKMFSRYMYNMKGTLDINWGTFDSWRAYISKHVRKVGKPVYSNAGRYEVELATAWWRKQVLAPLVMKVQEVLPDFDRSALWYTDSSDFTSSDRLTEVSRVRVEGHLFNIIHVHKPLVVVAHGVGRLPSRMYEAEIPEAANTGHNCRYFAYIVSRKKGEAERVVEALKRIPDIVVLDLTGRLPSEQKAYEEILRRNQERRDALKAGKPVPAPRKAKVGLVRLDQILTSSAINTTLMAEDDVERITDPEFVIEVSMAEGNRERTHWMSGQVLNAIGKLYGDKGGVSNQSRTVEKYKSKGVPDVRQYVTTRILHDVENDQELIQYMQCSWDKAKQYFSEKADWSTYSRRIELVRALLTNPIFKDLCPSITATPDDVLHKMAIWNELHEFMPGNFRKQFEALRIANNNIMLDKPITDFLDKLISNHNLDVINSGSFVNLANGSPGQQEKAREFAKVFLSTN